MITTEIIDVVEIINAISSINVEYAKLQKQYEQSKSLDEIYESKNKMIGIRESLLDKFVGKFIVSEDGIGEIYDIKWVTLNEYYIPHINIYTHPINEPREITIEIEV